MRTSSVKKFPMLFVIGLLLMSLAAQCGGAAEPQVVEKVVTVEVEKEVEKIVTIEVEKEVEVEKVVTVEVEKEVEAPMGSFNSADRAVEEAKKYAGTTIVVNYEAGLQEQDGFFFGPKWEELTGIKVEVAGMDYNDMYSVVLQDHLTGAASYDVLTFSPSWLIDFVAAGALEPLNPYIDKYMNKGDLEDILPTYATEGYAKVGDTWYGLPDDGDVYILYYQKSLFEDPENQAEFKAQYGYDLAPPKTWKEFDEIGTFFTDKYAPDIYGAGLARAIPFPFYEWNMIFSSYGGQYFDLETMKPLINSEIGVRALTEMAERNKFMPPGVEQWSFMENLSAWMDGKSAMTITWPPFGRWSEGLGATTEQLSWVPTTKVAGNVGYAVPPGGRTELAGGFSFGVSADSENKEAAYLFIQWMNSPEISLQRVMLPFALRDPYRISHFESPLYNAAWPAAPDYLETLKEAALVGQADLGFPGAQQYRDQIEIACSAVWGGADPQEALDKAAEGWEEITERLGRDSQREAYKLWLEGPWNKPGPTIELPE